MGDWSLQSLKDPKGLRQEELASPVHLQAQVLGDHQARLGGSDASENTKRLYLDGAENAGRWLLKGQEFIKQPSIPSGEGRKSMRLRR